MLSWSDKGDFLHLISLACPLYYWLGHLLTPCTGRCVIIPACLTVNLIKMSFHLVEKTAFLCSIASYDIFFTNLSIMG